MITFSRDFHLIEVAYQQALAAGAKRADSKGNDLDVSGVLWDAYLTRVQGSKTGARADARSTLARRIAGAAFQGPQAMTVRADASHFFADDLTDRDQRVTVKPQRPNALLASIPVSPVAPWAEHWTAKYGEESGVAVPWKKGTTDTRFVDYSVSEVPRPMMLFRADVQEFTGDAEQNAMASHDFGSQAEQSRRALEAHYKAHNAGLLSGVAGFAGYHLGNLPGVLRVNSATIYGTTGADTALPEFKRVLERIGVQGKGAIGGPNTALISQRMFNALGGYLAFTQGGTQFSEALVAEMFRTRGITSVQVCNELEDFDGENRDAVVLFDSNNPDSLVQKMGLRPAPVKTFDVDLSRQTAFLSGFGGLHAKVGGSVLVYTAGVVA